MNTVLYAMIFLLVAALLLCSCWIRYVYKYNEAKSCKNQQHTSTAKLNIKTLTDWCGNKDLAFSKYNFILTDCDHNLNFNVSADDEITKYSNRLINPWHCKH